MARFSKGGTGVTRAITRVLVGLVVIGTLLTTLVTCQPIQYYLQQVFKAYGKVMEKGSSEPIESVEVFVSGSQYSELTNGLGDYEIELPQGTWMLDFKRDGYKPIDPIPVTVGPGANKRVQVNAELEKIGPEYYISFTFDGTPFTYTQGFLETGNVAFAAAETGWQYHDQGPVYDRTHIMALLEGLSLSEDVHAHYYIEIVLIGDVGSQPPATGEYTFSDGYHGICQVGYNTPGSSSELGIGGSGTASVTLTTVGAVGDFIEGTFSAAYGSHSIADGQFRVKHVEPPPMGP